MGHDDTARVRLDGLVAGPVPGEGFARWLVLTALLGVAPPAPSGRGSRTSDWARRWARTAHRPPRGVAKTAFWRGSACDGAAHGRGMSITTSSLSSARRRAVAATTDAPARSPSLRLPERQDIVTTGVTTSTEIL